MPQRPIDDYWKERVKSLLGADPRREPGPRAIKRHLDAEAERMDRTEIAKVGYPPSERSITRIRDAEWQTLPEQERREYRELHWPDTFVRGDLPWEASGAALELLAWSNDARLPRPPISITRWYWRICQAMPDTEIKGRIAITATVASHQDAGLPLPEGWEWFLAYAPWKQGNRPRYDRALERHDNPIPRCEFGIQVANGGPSSAWAARFLFNSLAKDAIDDKEE
jgi:hypothetical protein